MRADNFSSAVIRRDESGRAAGEISTATRETRNVGPIE